MSNPLSCGQLAELIEAVADKDTSDTSIETCIEEIQESDMAVVEWLCRLIPKSTIEALKAHEQTPLWGEHAVTADEISRPGPPEPSDRERRGLRMIRTGNVTSASDADAADRWIDRVLNEKPSEAVETECRTRLGGGRIRDGETRDLRKCLDCNGTGVA